MQATVIFPHQLFHNHPGFGQSDKVLLVEDPLLFGTDRVYPIKFHKQKLMLHRASMRAFAYELEKKGKRTVYLEVHDQAKTLTSLWRTIGKEADTIHVVDVVDDVLRERIERYSSEHGLALVWHDTPNFYLS